MLKTAIRILVVLVLAAAATMAVLHYTGHGPASRGSGRLTIHFTCDAAGRLQPCGCFTGQHGGLTRLRTWLDGREYPGPVLKLDAGGAIAGTADYDIIQYRYMTRAYATMGFSALNMGAREAAIPATELTQLAATSPVPLVSASLVDAGSRKALLEPYRIIKLGGTRVGVLGVVSPNSVSKSGEGLAVLGLNEAVDRHLPELAAQTDLVILLAFADETEMRRLAKDYYEFALILGGDVPGSTQEILRENDSIILFTTNQARTVGTLSARIGGGKRKHLLDPAYEIELLWDVIPQDAGLLELVREYRNEIRNTPLAIDDPDAVDPSAIPGVAMNASYVGSAICKECHVEDHEIWEKSAHSHAFETLVKAGSDADPHCVSCHTVGFGKDSGYRRPMGGRSLVDVGCESCHGPASEHIARHVDNKPNGFKFRPLGPGDCKSCHYGEFSRPFDWDTFWPGIAHGAKVKAAK